MLGGFKFGKHFVFTSFHTPNHQLLKLETPHQHVMMQHFDIHGQQVATFHVSCAS